MATISPTATYAKAMGQLKIEASRITEARSTSGDEIRKEKVIASGSPAAVKPMNSGMDEQEQNGVTVHWAADADEHNRIVHGILAAGGVKKLVKSKSMLTEECGLNPYLEQRGIEVIDTDLGERIVQLRHEPPSHIVMPAIHLKKEQISELFHKELGTEAAQSFIAQVFEKYPADYQGAEINEME